MSGTCPHGWPWALREHGFLGQGSSEWCGGQPFNSLEFTIKPESFDVWHSARFRVTRELASGPGAHLLPGGILPSGVSQCPIPIYSVLTGNLTLVEHTIDTSANDPREVHSGS